MWLARVSFPSRRRWNEEGRGRVRRRWRISGMRGGSWELPGESKSTGMCKRFGRAEARGKFRVEAHPERSRFSGGGRDLIWAIDAAREIPRPAGENPGLRDDAILHARPP